MAIFSLRRPIELRHIKPDAAAHDNARNNFMEQRGWRVLRFGTKQLTDDLLGCVRSVTTLINRCGGLILSDDSRDAAGWVEARAVVLTLGAGRLPGACQRHSLGPSHHI